MPSGATPRAAAIKLKPSFGPPNSATKVIGTGFGANEQVVITFDSVQVGTSTTDGTGRFAKKIKVPASAKPGGHTVKAKGQSSGSTASKKFLVRTDWARFRFADTNSGSNPYENVLDRSNVSGLNVAWSYPTPGVTLSSSAAVVGGSSISDRSTRMCTHSTLPRGFKWSYPTSTVFEKSSLAVAGEVVYIGVDDDVVYALDAATGAFKWSYKTGNEVSSSPAVANGVVYVGSLDCKG
jgi:outer membrane protein assembly factor BamB